MLTGRFAPAAVGMYTGAAYFFTSRVLYLDITPDEVAEVMLPHGESQASA